MADDGTIKLGVEVDNGRLTKELGKVESKSVAAAK